MSPNPLASWDHRPHLYVEPMDPLTPGGGLPQVRRPQARGKTLCSPLLTSVNYHDQAESFSTKAAYALYRSQLTLQQCPPAGLEPTQATSGSRQATTVLLRPGSFTWVHGSNSSYRATPRCRPWGEASFLADLFLPPLSQQNARRPRRPVSTPD